MEKIITLAVLTVIFISLVAVDGRRKIQKKKNSK